MKPAGITFGIMLRIWWAYTWRLMLGVWATSFLLGFSAALLTKRGLEESTAENSLVVLSLLVSLFWSIYCFKFILAKDFGDFKILLTSSS
jgi:hypothetical protein